MAKSAESKPTPKQAPAEDAAKSAVTEAPVGPRYVVTVDGVDTKIDAANEIDAWAKWNALNGSNYSVKQKRPQIKKV